MGTLDNLYPPVINTYMPAFVVEEKEGKYTGSTKIYFSISKYNSIEDIGQVWLAVNDQYTNRNLTNSKTGLLRYSLNKDNNRKSDDKYYITLEHNQLLNKTWEINKSYKIQIRFSNISNEIMEEELKKGENGFGDGFLVKNQDYFSEWSTVSLLYPILQPELKLNGYNEESETIFSSMNNNVIGKVNFKDNETLESYRIKIFKKGQKEPDFDSGDITTGIINSSEINYTPIYGFLDGEHYSLKVSYLTTNLYTEEKTFNFMIIDSIGRELNAKLYITPENELGRMKLHLTLEEYYLGNITIRRTSSRSNFSVWEDVHTFMADSSDLIDYIWYDYTIESGVWYKYCAQKRSGYGDRGLIIKAKEKLESPEYFVKCNHKEEVEEKYKEQSMVYLNDMFLSGENNQHLKIKFDPQINSFTHTLLESSVQAIGSKYPFIRRNAEVNYRQFPISGLISYHMDDGNLFTNKEILLNNNNDLYEEYNEEQNISQYKDFTLEREFRNKVKDFLYNGKVKLFKSATEGNILVRLMNISFTPKAELGRMIYSFSATAYEIDDLTLRNLDKYNIQKIGEIQEVILSTYERFGQKEFIIPKSESDQDLIKIFQEDEFAKEDGIIRKITSFRDLVLKIDGIPYPIKIDNSGTYTINKFPEGNYENNSQYLLGYLIEINNEKIYINKDGNFTINPDMGLEVNSLKIINPNQEIRVLLQGVFSVEETEDETKAPKNMNIIAGVGQIGEVVNQNINIIDLIYKKYYSFNSPEYQKILSINSLRIETEPYSVFYLRDDSELEERTLVIGETGVLNIETDYTFKSLRYGGKVDLENQSEEGNKMIVNKKEFFTTHVFITYSYDLEKGEYKKALSEVSNQ